MIVLEVAVAAPVTGTYTYRLSSNINEQGDHHPRGLIGHRVIVPFGRRKLTGYVLEVSEAVQPDRQLKAISSIPDHTPLFGAALVPLFKWVSNYYHYPIGEVIKTALPRGLTARFQKHIVLKSKTDLSAYLAQTKKFPWIATLFETGEINPPDTRIIFSSGPQRRLIKKLERDMVIAVEDRRKSGEVKKRTEWCYHLPADRWQPPAGQRQQPRRLALDQHTAELSSAEKKVVKLLSDYQQKGLVRGAMPRKELIAHYPYGAKIVKKLINKGLVAAVERRVYRSPLGNPIDLSAPPVACNRDQKRVIKRVRGQIKTARFGVFLLHGVTGSGKTEVYLQCTESTIAQNKSVIILVPEIALATQVEESFVGRFGDSVALLHSGLSIGEKYDQWCRIAAGNAKIVIGARSAVFAPSPDLGLIIVDEEHDSSFKQEEGLRYHGRDVAIMRAKQNNAVAILGSATPAVSSYFNTRQGKYELLELPQRVGQRRLPTVKILDLKTAAGKSAATLFRQPFVDRLQGNFEQGNQSIVLLNKRGFSASVICRDCGALVECKHCKVSLTYHKSRKQLVCHYCSFTLPDRITCAVCGSLHMVPIGFGTEKVEEELNGLFPKASIARIDSDTAHHRGKFLKILQGIKDREIDIVVGTQMISKGLHFPGVTFVGIVWADTGLSIPDFKAAERTYQLISQVTGRAGRGEKPGDVIIQTLQPDHYAIKLAAAHDYQALVAQEITIRKATGFPPFSRLVSIKVEGDSAQQVCQNSGEIAALARKWCAENQEGETLTVLGPSPCPLERLRNKFRWQLLLKSRSLTHTARLIAFLQKTVSSNKGNRILYDIDPESMM